MKKVGGNLTAVSLSADGHRVAVTARGEVFDVPADKGVTRDITRTPGANERDAVWSPDGKYIAYISDRTGETEVWLQPSEGGEPIQLTENNDTYIRQLMWSPNSKKSALHRPQKPYRGSRCQLKIQKNCHAKP